MDAEDAACLFFKFIKGGFWLLFKLSFSCCVDVFRVDFISTFFGSVICCLVSSNATNGEVFSSKEPGKTSGMY